MMFLNTHNEWMKMQQMMHSSSADGGMMMMGHEGMIGHEGMMKYGHGREEYSEYGGGVGKR
jgi:hypothetical protein